MMEDNIAKELIMKELDDVKKITSEEITLIEQISVLTMPNKVVNQADLLKSRFVRFLTSAEGYDKYIGLRFVAINKLLAEIKKNWNDTIPTEKERLDLLKDKVDTLVLNVSNEYNTLLKIENAIKKEIENREQAISDEKTAREDADTNLQTNINTEATTRETADITLQTNIDTEKKTRETADTTLQTNINTEATTRETADITLQKNIDTEKKTRETADTTLQTNINKALEESKKFTNQAISDLVNGAEGTLDTLKELADALGNDSNFATTITNTIARIKTELGQAISDEATTRETADITLQTNIDTEKTAREDADTNLQTNINTEKKAREDADTTLGERITNLTAEKIKAKYDKEDTNVQTAIETLKNLCGTLSGNTSTQETAINDILGRVIKAENANTTLQTNINTEKTARETADADLGKRITNLIAENIKAKYGENEASNVQAAINSILGRLDTAETGLGTNQTAIETNQTAIAAIQKILSVNDVDYDTLQEIVTMLKSDNGGGINALANHLANANNPHSTTKAQVGLGNAENTADINKNVNSAKKLTTARNITVGSKTKSFDGSADITFDNVAEKTEVMKVQILPQNVDLDTICTAGSYRIQGGYDGGPFGYIDGNPYLGSYGTVLVIRGGSDTGIQLLAPYIASKLYCRTGRGLSEGVVGDWNSWREIIFADDISTEATAGKVVQRNSEGQIKASYINSSIKQEDSLTPTSVYIESNNDSWIRKVSAAHFINRLGLLTVNNGLKLVASTTGALEPSNLANGTYLVLPLDGYNYFLWSDQDINGNRYMQSIGIWTVNGSSGQMNFSGANSYTFFYSTCECVAQCNLYKIN